MNNTFEKFLSMIEDGENITTEKLKEFYYGFVGKENDHLSEDKKPFDMDAVEKGVPFYINKVKFIFVSHLDSEKFVAKFQIHTGEWEVRTFKKPVSSDAYMLPLEKFTIVNKDYVFDSEEEANKVKQERFRTTDEYVVVRVKM